MSSKSRTIVVVGGVAGGASAAARARRCNEQAEIIVFERSGFISFANCGLPYYLGGEIAERQKLLVSTPEHFRRRFRIDVRTHHEVLAIDRTARRVRVLDHNSGNTFEQPYDRLILAPGAEAVVPNVAGHDAENVFVLRSMEDTDRIKAWLDHQTIRRAVIVGGGFIGLEMVEQLKRRAVDVALVELLPQVLAPLDAEMAHVVETELRQHDVRLHLNDGLVAIDAHNGRATHVRTASGAAIPADLVLLGVGVRPNSRLAREAGLEVAPSGGVRVNPYMQTSDPAIYAVGDAVEYQHAVAGRPVPVPLAGPANRAGRIAGQHAAMDEAPPMTPVLGTAIVRVFDITAATTGLSLKFARQCNQPATAVTIEAKHHAGYFPGAKLLLIKLVYEPLTGRVLGAQAVGPEGVDKRIDIIATAIQMRATVRDLAGIDLAYAPPYGSAKDPVHMAAFVASNQLDGLLNIVQPDADLSGRQIVDVRTPQEFAADHLDEAIHIPLDELRDRLHQLEPQRDTVTVCRSGLRSYIAARILMQHGFARVADLTGGMLMRRHAEAAGLVASPTSSASSTEN